MRNVLSASLLLVSFLLPAQLLAEELTKEQRAQMADMHLKAAECLKSDKSVEQCHKEMMDNCPMAKDGKSCPMMGMMHHGRKMKSQK